MDLCPSFLPEFADIFFQHIVDFISDCNFFVEGLALLCVEEFMRRTPLRGANGP